MLCVAIPLQHLVTGILRILDRYSGDPIPLQHFVTGILRILGRFSGDPIPLQNLVTGILRILGGIRVIQRNVQSYSSIPGGFVFSDTDKVKENCFDRQNT